jgi:hypothetical protein
MQLVYGVPNIQLLECVNCDLSVIEAAEELDLAPSGQQVLKRAAVPGTAPPDFAGAVGSGGSPGTTAQR